LKTSQHQVYCFYDDGSGEWFLAKTYYHRYFCLLAHHEGQMFTRNLAWLLEKSVVCVMCQVYFGTECTVSLVTL